MNRLYSTRIPELDLDTGRIASEYINTLTKPPGSLGRLEELAIQLAQMTGDPMPAVFPPGVIVFAADHGITEEGVSAFPQEVTKQMVRNFLQGGAAINVFSRQIGAEFKIVDIGVSSDCEESSADSLLDASMINKFVTQKVRYGTANFCHEDAMTRNEAEQALQIGFEQAEKMIREGIKCLIPGEMGIGNTTASSAILAVLSGQDIRSLVGQGSGIAEDQVPHKQEVILRAIASRKPNRQDPIDILSKIGGLEIAGMAGAMLGAASHRIPILIDGFICSISALVAQGIAPGSTDYMIVGHRSVETGHDVAIQLLQKKPLLDLGLRLGEGSGAAVAFPLLQSATLMIKEMATFSSAGISTGE